MDIWDCIDEAKNDNRDNEADYRDTDLISSLKTAEQEFEIEYEYEIERAYGVPYGKYISRLDTKYFDSDEYRQTFQVLTQNRELNENIYKYSRQSILDNWGTDKESMFLIDMDNNELIASIESDRDKRSLEISYTNEFRESLNKAIQHNTKIVAIHNHPNGYPPSLDDISKVAENHYELAIVAGANGLIYKYQNPSKKVFTEDDCKNNHQLISFNVESGYDIDRAYREVYDTLGVSYEIIEGGRKNE